MPRILVFQHSTHVHAGRLGATLRDHGYLLDIVRLDLTPELAPTGVRTTVPDGLDGVDGIVSLGGTQNVDEGCAWIEPEKALLRAAHEQDIPIVGLCLGHQLLCEALGGTVEKMDAPEVGLVEAELLFPGQTDALLYGMPWNHYQLMSHGYQVTQAPPGASVLMRTAKCPIGGVHLGMRSFGFQSHPECDRAMIESFAGRDDGPFAGAGLVGEKLKAHLDERYDNFARVSDRLCVNLASLVFGAMAGV